MIGRKTTIAAVLCVALGSSLARADGTSDRMAAEALSRAAAMLMSEGRYDEGCAKYDEAEGLDPSAARMLLVGQCNERRGRTASAWEAFTEAQAMAEGRADDGRALVARQGIERLESSLTRLAIVVPKTSQTEGLEVRSDGRVLSPALFSVPVPVDARIHLIEVTAPRHRTWLTQIGIAPGHTTITVTVPLLEEVPTRSLPASTVSDVHSALAHQASSPGADPGAAQRTVGWILGGTGVLGIATGTILGLRARSKAEELSSACIAQACGAMARDVVRQVRTETSVADLSLALGAGSLVAGFIVYLLAPSGAAGEPKVSRVRMSPTVDAQAAGLVAVGTF